MLISSCSEHLEPNFFKICNDVRVHTLYTSVYKFFPISIFELKNSVFDSKRLSLRVWNILNQISSKFTISFLLLLFNTSADTISSCLNLQGKKTLRPKTCISSRLEHIQQNFVKLGNIIYKSLFTYPVYNIFCHVSSLLTITFFQIP